MKQENTGGNLVVLGEKASGEVGQLHGRTALESPEDSIPMDRGNGGGRLEAAHEGKGRQKKCRFLS